MRKDSIIIDAKVILGLFRAADTSKDIHRDVYKLLVKLHDKFSLYFVQKEITSEEMSIIRDTSEKQFPGFNYQVIVCSDLSVLHADYFVGVSMYDCKLVGVKSICVRDSFNSSFEFDGIYCVNSAADLLCYFESEIDSAGDDTRERLLLEV